MNPRTRHITREYVADKLERFEAAGGLIERLPPQSAPWRNMVGGRYGKFEELDFLAGKIDAWMDERGKQS